MDELFDTLARDAAGRLTRRQVFGRFGWGLVLAVAASLGLTRSNNSDCAKCCAACCRGNTPPGDPTPGDCMRDCLEGRGQCVGCVPVCSETA